MEKIIFGEKDRAGLPSAQSPHENAIRCRLSFFRIE